MGFGPDLGRGGTHRRKICNSERALELAEIASGPATGNLAIDQTTDDSDPPSLA
jgi:hypothetical protein